MTGADHAKTHPQEMQAYITDTVREGSSIVEMSDTLSERC